MAKLIGSFVPKYFDCGFVDFALYCKLITWKCGSEENIWAEKRPFN